MYVEGNSSHFIVTRCSTWYRVSILMEVVNALRKINFSVVEQRQQALERINNIEASSPFDANNRFPASDAYVTECWGDWARKFQQLKNALSHKERDIRTQVKETSTEAKTDAGSVSDAQQAFWNATTAMMDQLIRGDGVFDRAKFEDLFGFHWVNPDNNPQQ